MTPRQRKRKRQALVKRMSKINCWMLQLTQREYSSTTRVSCGRMNRERCRRLSQIFGDRFAWRYRFGGYHDDGALWARGKRLYG